MNQENFPQPEFTQSLADSQKESNIGDEKEKGISPEEVRKQLEQNTISKYQRLLDVINSSLKNGNITQDQYDKSILDIDNLSEKELGFKVTERYTSQEKANEIMGNDYLGSEAVEKAFDIKLEINEIPAIPFSMGELEKAKELGQMLILRQPITMEQINDSLGGKVKDGKKLLYSVDESTGKLKDDAWYKDEEFYKNEKPEAKWALISKEVIPDSESKNYLDQTDKIVGYLQNQVFKDKPMPKEYQEAIDDYLKAKVEIAKTMKSDWEKAAEMLEGLKITELTRQSPAEALYDLVLYFQTNGEKLLPNRYTWTKHRDSVGELVFVGSFGSGGVNVRRWGPGGSRGDLGVSFSRSL